MKSKEEIREYYPDPPAQEEEAEYSLEDILKEFGGEEASSASDPALQTPIPRHRTVDGDAGTQRSRPREEDLPQRHIPQKEPAPQQPEPEAVSLASAAPEKPTLQAAEPEPKDEPRHPKTQRPHRESPARKPVRPTTGRKEPTRKPKPIVMPEARYRQALQGMGGRSLRLILCLLVTIAALVLGYSRDQGLLDTYKNQDFLGFGELALLLLTALLAYDVLSDGLMTLLKPGFGFSTLVTLETLVCLVDGVFAMLGGRPSYCPLLCMNLTCALWGLQLRCRAEASAMDVARGKQGGLAVVREPGVFQKMPAALAGSGSLQEFLQCVSRTPGPTRILSTYCLLLLGLSAVVAGMTVTGDTGLFFRNWTAVLLAGTPLMGALVSARPWAIAARRLKEKGAALYGWTGACRLSGKLAVLISDRDLFPRENLKLNGVKYYGGQPPDRVVAYGAAVLTAAGSGLAPVFEEQVRMRGARHQEASELRRYENGGIGAEINGESVLVGTLRFMQSMGVEMPAGTRVSQAVYVAIDGILAGVFAIHYGVTRGVAEGLGTLTACRGVTPVITAGDFMITEPFLKSKFRVRTDHVKIPSLNARADLSRREPSKDAKPCALIQSDRFPTTALTVTVARALRTAVRWGTLVALAGGIMGLFIMTVLANLSAGNVMSLINLTLFQLLWAIPGLLLSGWPGNV